MNQLYSSALAALLTYNNSLILLGPTAWSGVGPRRALLVALAGLALGTATSPLRPVELDTPLFLYVLVTYLAFSAVRLALPLSVMTYASRHMGPTELAMWLISPALAAAATCSTYALRGLLSPLRLPSLFLLWLLFGQNNLAVLGSWLPTVAGASVGVLFGLGFSRWSLDLLALSGRAVVVVNLSVSLASAMGNLLGVPLSFTLMAYASLTAAALLHGIRLARWRKLAGGYLALLLALALAALFGRLVTV